MKKKFYYTIRYFCWALLFLPLQTIAQQDNSPLTVQGKVVDNKSGELLHFASVALLNTTDSSVIDGNYTNEKGRFSFSVKARRFLLKISFLGYQDRLIPVDAKKKDTRLDLGTIGLTPLSNELSTLTVTAEEAPMYEFKDDSIVFNVPEGFQTGGTAQDVLEYAPSLTLDADNNIRIKGQGNVGVYIDSKPISDLGFNVNEYLQNTPAFMIEKVEILKTPPDPEDAAKALAAGVTDRYYLNIITRKIRYRGYNAAVTAGLNSHNEQTARMRFNMNMKPFRLDYSNNLRRRTDSSYLHRTSFLENNDSTVLDQKSYHKSMDLDHNLNARYTFQFSEKEELRLRARFDWDYDKDEGSDISHITTPKSTPDQNRNQNNESRSTGYSISSSADYKKEFDKEGKELNASINLRQRSSNRNRFSTGAYLIKGDTLLQRNKGNNTSSGLRSHLQYKNTFGSENKHFYLVNGSFSFGQRHNLNNVSRSDTSTISNEMHKNRRLSTNYFSEDKDYGFLVLLGKRDKKLGWVAATSVSYKVNGSHDDYRGSSVNSHVLSSRNAIGFNYSPKEDQRLTVHFNPGFQRYEQNTIPNDSVGLISYKYANFIPGASAKYEMGHHELSFHYDRKLDLPNWRQLNPYVDNSDPLNIRTGNPDLRPEFTNEYKLRYEFEQDIFYTSLNLEDAISTDVISSYTTVDSSGVSTRTYVNLNNRKRQSAELNAGVHYFKNIPGWEASINVNAGGGLSAYSMQSDDKHVSEDFQNVSGFTGNFKLWTSLKYKFISLNVNGRYNGPRYFSQGKRPSHFSSGLRTRATFFEHALSISMGIENLFGASVKDNFYKTDRYIQYSNNRHNVRYFSVYVTYQFRDYKKLGHEDGRG